MPASIRPRRVLGLGIPLGLAIGLGVAVAMALWSPRMPAVHGDLSALDDGATTSITGDRFTLTDSMRTFPSSVWIDKTFAGVSVDRTEVTCHGGRATISWSIGNLEPVATNIGIDLTIRLDGVPIGAALRGSAVDTWGDMPVSIRTVVDCPPGPHVVDLLLGNVDGAWGFPYVQSYGQPPSPDSVIGRGFIVQETWSSTSAAAE